MTVNSNPSELFSPFLDTTYNVPEEDDRLKVFLVDRFSQFADVINQKKIGVYGPYENQNGEQWFYKTTSTTRNGYQAILYLPSLVSGIYPLPIQGIDANFVITNLWGSSSKPATTPGSGAYAAFYSQGNPNVTFLMTDLSLTVTANPLLSVFSCIFVIEYLRVGT